MRKNHICVVAAVAAAWGLSVPSAVASASNLMARQAVSASSVQSASQGVAASQAVAASEGVAAGDSVAAGRHLVLSLSDCVRIALDQNPTVKVADMEITRTDYSKKEVLASLLPTVDFSLSYSRSLELQRMRMNFGGESQTIKMGTDNSWNMGFSASVPVVAPQLWKQLQLSDTQIMANVESARASRLDLVNQVNQAYYALLLAYASKEVIQQNYDNAVLNASIYEKKFAVGTASEYDVLRSSVQVKNVEPELLQADIAIKQARLQLCILLGFDVSYEISTDMTLKQYQRDMFAYTSGLDRSIADNSSLRSLDIQTKALEQTVDLKKLAWAPTMAATFNYNWNSMSNGNMFKNISFNPYSSVGFSIAVPIFSGGSKYYGLKGAKVQLAEARLNRDNLVNSLNMQVDLAIDNINKEVSQIESSEEGVRQADKAYEIMQKSFEIGAATYLDLRDSELAQTSARLSYYQAIYNYLVSTSELDLLLGKSVAPSVTTK